MKPYLQTARRILCMLLTVTLVLPVSPGFSWEIFSDRPADTDEGTFSRVLVAQGSKAGDWRTIVSSDPNAPSGEPSGYPPAEPPAFPEPPVGPPAEQYPEPPDDPEPGPAAPTESSESPAKVDIGPQGGDAPWNGGKVRVTVPPGALDQNVSITAEKPSMPVQRDPESGISENDVLVAASVELGPSGTRFSRPVEVVMQIPPETRERIAKGRELVVAVVNGDTIEQVTDFRVDDQGRVHFQLDHFSAAFVLAFTGMVLVAVMAIGGRMIVTDSPHLLVQPDNKDVQKFIRDGNVKLPGTINQSGPTDLGINKTYSGTMGVFKVMNGGGAMVRMKNGSKVNCQDLSFLAASILLASGDPRFKDVICVGGNATAGGYSGGHMWVEVKIDGKVYVVDTTNPKRLNLIPAAEAYSKFKLEPGFQFGHKKRRKPYVGWDGKPGADNFSAASSTSSAEGQPLDPNAEPTDEQLKQAYQDGYDMGCSHMSMSPEAIKAELRETYGKISNMKLRVKFREGYAAGAEKCKPR